MQYKINKIRVGTLANDKKKMLSILLKTLVLYCIMLSKNRVAKLVVLNVSY